MALGSSGFISFMWHAPAIGGPLNARRTDDPGHIICNNSNNTKATLRHIAVKQEIHLFAWHSYENAGIRVIRGDYLPEMANKLSPPKAPASTKGNKCLTESISKITSKEDRFREMTDGLVGITNEHIVFNPSGREEYRRAASDDNLPRMSDISLLSVVVIRSEGFV